VALVLLLFTTAPAAASPDEQSGPIGPVPADLLVPYEVLGGYPHDRGAYLQGLVWHDGGFYESTGLNGESSLRRVAFPSGDVLQKTELSREYFAEGLALVGDRLIQLTWRTQKGFVYDRETFGLISDFKYNTEGWGLTYDGVSLIMSDGSDTLFFLEPDTYEPYRAVKVTMAGRSVQDLNELEWINGQIWANVWQTNYIVRIDPESGNVVGVLDMKGLLPSDVRTGNEDVLNGIAYDESTGRIFVSGKRWPTLFEIRVP
jgi:glutamine cyclotransferase